MPALAPLHTTLSDMLSSKASSRTFERLFHEFGLQSAPDVSGANFGVGVDAHGVADALAAAPGVTLDRNGVGLLRPQPALSAVVAEVAKCPLASPPLAYYAGVGRDSDLSADSKRLKRVMKPLKSLPGVSPSEVKFGSVDVVVPAFAPGERDAAVQLDAALRFTPAAAPAVEQAACAVRRVMVLRWRAIDALSAALAQDETDARFGAQDLFCGFLCVL